MIWETLLSGIQKGDHRSLARAISLVENGVNGYEELMERLSVKDIPLIGITGPPGAGKSTLVDALLEKISEDGKKVAVLCIDPSSPFHRGAVLGDRIRMNQWHDRQNVYIRSLASRGALGGLHPRIIEVCEILQSSAFDMIIIETIGVGQNEVEIAGLADCTILVTVPESGDEIQTMKAGIMEIADLFVVNKADRPEADRFVQNLQKMMAPAFSAKGKDIPILKTTGIYKTGIDELYQNILRSISVTNDQQKKAWLLTERAYRLIIEHRMKEFDKEALHQKIIDALKRKQLNLYKLVKPYM
jgi:LAO/AO transport system kinase